MLRGCRLQAKRCGLRAYGDATVALTDCVLEDCGEQGAKAFDRAALTLCRYVRVQNRARTPACSAARDYAALSSCSASLAGTFQTRSQKLGLSMTGHLMTQVQCML